MSGLSLLPAVFVDFFGSALAIVFAFAALGYARGLIRLQPNNFIWGFLWYFCLAMAAFSLSRGVGHMVRVILVYSGHAEVWSRLSPLSGGFNTMLMISVAAVTIYYHKGLAAYKAIRSEAEKLAVAAEQLQRLNTELEERVEERTRDLSSSEKKFRNFFENSKDIVYFSNVDGTVTNINSSGIRLLGFEDTSERINIHRLFKRDQDVQRYQSNLKEHGFVSDLEIECLCRDGVVRHILLSANAIYDEGGTVTGYEGIGKDMTRLHLMTEQLINHEKMASVGQMAAGVAHEINTPLGIILGYAQLMMDDFETGSEAHTNMAVIERQTKACRRIVADLLKFSRQGKSNRVLMDLNEIIREVLAVTEHTLNINNIKVEREFDPQLPQLIGDPEKFHQVFINLFTNAQHAMIDGGILTVRTEHRNGSLELSVIDTGCGVPEEIKNRIFDPFFTTKEVGEGTGLGLSVTYGIIQEHGGQIRVESPVLDQQTGAVSSGSRFRISIPVQRQETVPEEG